MEGERGQYRSADGEIVRGTFQRGTSSTAGPAPAGGAMDVVDAPIPGAHAAGLSPDAPARLESRTCNRGKASGRPRNCLPRPRRAPGADTPGQHRPLLAAEGPVGQGEHRALP